MFGFFRHDDNSTGSNSTTDHPQQHQPNGSNRFLRPSASLTRIDSMQKSTSSAASGRKTPSYRRRGSHKNKDNDKDQQTKKQKSKRTRSSFGRRMKKHNIHFNYSQKKDKNNGSSNSSLTSKGSSKSSSTNKRIAPQHRKSQEQSQHSSLKNDNSSAAAAAKKMEVLEEHNDGIEVSLELQQVSGQKQQQGKHHIETMKKRSTTLSTEAATTSESDDTVGIGSSSNNQNSVKKSDDKLDDYYNNYFDSEEIVANFNVPRLSIDPSLLESKKLYMSQFSIDYSLIANSNDNKELLLYDKYSKGTNDDTTAQLFRISQSISNDGDDDKDGNSSSDDSDSDDGGGGKDNDQYLSILGQWGSPFGGLVGGDEGRDGDNVQRSSHQKKPKRKEQERRKHRIDFNMVDVKILSISKTGEGEEKEEISHREGDNDEQEDEAAFDDMLSILEQYKTPSEEALVVKDEIYKLNNEINHLEQDRLQFTGKLNKTIFDDDDDDDDEDEDSDSAATNDEDDTDNENDSDSSDDTDATNEKKNGNDELATAALADKKKKRSSSYSWDVHWLLNDNNNNKINLTLDQRMKLQRSRGQNFTLHMNNPRARDAFMTKCSKVGGACRDNRNSNNNDTSNNSQSPTEQHSSPSNELHFHTTKNHNFKQVESSVSSLMRKETISLGPHNCRSGGSGETMRHISILKGKDGTSFFLSKDYPINYNNTGSGNAGLDSSTGRPNSPHTLGHTGNSNNNLSYVWGYLPTPLYKRMKREGLDLGSHDTDLLYLSSGPRGCYYCEFVNGNIWWGNAISGDNDFFTIMEDWNVYRVSFGPIITKEDDDGKPVHVNSWIILGKDGRAAWKNIPSRLHNMLCNRLADMPAIAEVTLGPSDSYFIRFLDGMTDYCLPAEISHTLCDIERRGGKVTNLLMHPEVSHDYIVRHTEVKC